MINIFEVQETNKMIEKQNLDVRTITLGINLLDCADSDVNVVAENIYNKINNKIVISFFNIITLIYICM